MLREAPPPPAGPTGPPTCAGRLSLGLPAPPRPPGGRRKGQDPGAAEQRVAWAALSPPRGLPKSGPGPRLTVTRARGRGAAASAGPGRAARPAAILMGSPCSGRGPGACCGHPGPAARVPARGAEMRAKRWVLVLTPAQPTSAHVF